MGWPYWFWRDRVRSLFYEIRRNGKMAVVTSINLIIGGSPVHVTVVDQNGDPLNPNDVSWDLGSGTAFGFGGDATGFSFITSATGNTSINIHATYNGPGVSAPVTGPALTLNAIMPVTAIQYTSP